MHAAVCASWGGLSQARVWLQSFLVSHSAAVFSANTGKDGAHFATLRLPPPLFLPLHARTELAFTVQYLEELHHHHSVLAGARLNYDSAGLKEAASYGLFNFLSVSRVVWKFLCSSSQICQVHRILHMCVGNLKPPCLTHVGEVLACTCHCWIRVVIFISQ